MSDYDVAVIGAGPGGYVAAIRCAQLGMKVVCIDGWINHKGEAALGGTCLNVGCIPSKALLDSSHYYHALHHEFAEHGIKAENIEINIGDMLARKDKIVETLTGGIATLFTKHKIQWVHGFATLLSHNHVEVTQSLFDDHPKEIRAHHFIIATGSQSTCPDGIEIDDKLIVDSSGALSFDKVPKRFGVIGGGVIGLELGSVWNRLGSNTTILIRGDDFLRNAEPQIAKQSRQLLEKQGLAIKTGAEVKRVEKQSKTVKVVYQHNGEEVSQIFDRLLVATGRKPNTQHLHTESVGLDVDEKGFIIVNEHNHTNLPNFYAIGDVVRGPMLAHKASEEGIAVAEQLAGIKSSVHLDTIPWVIYTWPEIAWVGKTSEQLKKANIAYKEGAFPFVGNGRAHAMGTTGGLVKILSDKQTDQILGVHILGPSASELISEAVVAMEFKASAEDLARTVHAHPTLSEAMHEAALAVDGRPIHI